MNNIFECFDDNECDEKYFTENEVMENFNDYNFFEDKYDNMCFSNEIETKTTTLKINNDNKEKGRIDLKRKRKIHDRCELGNIRSKIKNKFHQFIIEFLNEKIKKKNFKLKFRKINYKFINLRNKTLNEKLMNMKIKEFLSFDISFKYKRINKDNNKKILKKTDFFMKKYYDLTYAEFYNKYFLKKKYFNYFINIIEQREIRLMKDKNSENNIEFNNYINKIKNLALNYTSYYNNKKTLL